MCQNTWKPFIYACNTAMQLFVHLRFIASLKLSFKFYPDDRGARRTSSRNRETICRADLRRPRPEKKGKLNDRYGNGVGGRRTCERRRLLRAWHGLFRGGGRRS